MGNLVCTPNVSSASLTIDVTVPSLLVAPAPITLLARPTGFDVSEHVPTELDPYDPSFHEIEYRWTITRPGGASSTFSTPTLNIPTGWKDRNVAIGKRISIAGDVAGNYAISCTATDRSGNAASASTGTIAVQDPDAAFPTTQTICCNPTGDGDFAWAPAGANTQQGWSNALTAYWNLTGQDGRMMFKPGATYVNEIGNFGSDFMAARGTNNVHFSGDVSNPPKFRWDENRSNVNFAIDGCVWFTAWKNAGAYKYACIDGIDFEGPWDTTKEAGALVKKEPIRFQSQGHHIVHRCASTGMNRMLSFGDSRGDFGDGLPTVISESSVTNWQDYGMQQVPSGSDQYPNAVISLIGCDISQSPDALGGGYGKSANNDHGPLRVGWMSNLFYYGCSMFSNNAWGTGVQPCIRQNSTQMQSVTGFYFGPTSGTIARCSFENGTIGLDGQSTGYPQFGYKGNNYLVDQCLFVNSAEAGQSIIGSSGGATVRNCIAVQPNVPQTGTASNFIDFTPGASSDATNVPQAFYGNSFVALSSGANNNGANQIIISSNTTTLFDTVHDLNNILWRPNSPTPDTAVTPVILATIAGFVPKYKGPLRNFAPEQLTSLNVTNGGTFTVAYPANTNQTYYTTTHPEEQYLTLWSDGGGYDSAGGDLSLSFGASNVTVTNNSGSTISGDWSARLQQTSNLPARDATKATPAGLTTKITPDTGSSALNAGVTTYPVLARQDFDGSDRGSPFDEGAVEV